MLRLSGPAWQGAAVAASRAVLSRPEDQVASWDVKAVASWMEAGDAHGIAAVFRANGVCGLDLLSFQDERTLAQDLRLTPFAARKVLLLRDAFLSSAS